MPTPIPNPTNATPAGRQAAERRLRARRDRFLGSAAPAVASFRALAVALEAVPASAAAIEVLWRETHRVHGAARAHGCVRASRLAGALERRVRGWVADPTLDRDERAVAVAGFAAALGIAFAADAEEPLAGR